MDIKTNGQIIKDKQRNSPKMRLTTGNLITIITIAVAIITNGVRLEMTARANCEKIAKVEEAPARQARWWR